MQREYGGLKGDQMKRPRALETENAGLRRAASDLTLDKLILTDAAKGNLSSPRAVAPVSIALCLVLRSRSEVPSVLAQLRSTQCKLPKTLDDEALLTVNTIELASRYGRCGYR